MSTRVIAAIGVVLCLAMTSFSIYLGVVEHSYTRTHVHAQSSITSLGGREDICMAVTPGLRVTPLSRAASAHGPCHELERG
jgi:hypothetical protein